MNPEAFFAGNDASRKLYEVVAREASALGKMSIRVTKSQIAFRRHRNFAVVWMPGQYLKGSTAPLVLTFSFPWRDTSPRWKEVVQPAPGRFTHHLELYRLADIDEQVRAWLRSAWEAG